MEFHRTKEAAAREIALAFGVPPMLLGLPGDNTYANYQEAHRAFYRLTSCRWSRRPSRHSGLAAPVRQSRCDQAELDQVPALADRARGVVAADRRSEVPDRRREAPMLGLSRLEGEE
jgi:phage portal protein BeeE